MSAFFSFELEPPPWLYRLMVRLGLMNRLYGQLGADICQAAPRRGLVIDVGAGPGQLLTLVGQARPDLRLLSVDHVWQMLRPISLASQSPSSPAMWRLVGDAAALPLRDACADLAVATFSFHTWEQPVLGLREMRRIVKPGKHSYIYEMNREASPAQLQAVARQEGLPYFLVAAGYWLLSWNHALDRRDFAAIFGQAGIRSWELQPFQEILWRAVF
jgi:ubiquinone/menaquinone biosynthesis C-methylase UbiE